jgi:hypothetical protein
MFQFNQVRRVEFDHNSITTRGCSNNALDPSRSPTEWSIHDNYICGSSGAGEAGAKISYVRNTFNCVATTNCVAFAGIYGGLISQNTIYSAASSDPNASPAAVYDSLGEQSPHTLITGNLIVSTGPQPAVRLATPGNSSVGNLITTAATGVDFQTGDATSRGDTIHLTTSSTYGCWLVEGTSHFDHISDGTCDGAGASAPGWAGVYVGDNGPQAAQLQIHTTQFRNLSVGIGLANPARDQPATLGLSFASVSTQRRQLRAKSR